MTTIKSSESTPDSLNNSTNIMIEYSTNMSNLRTMTMIISENTQRGLLSVMSKAVNKFISKTTITTHSISKILSVCSVNTQSMARRTFIKHITSSSFNNNQTNR